MRDFFIAAPFLRGFRPGLVTTRLSRAVRSRRFNIQQLSGHPPNVSLPPDAATETLMRGSRRPSVSNAAASVGNSYMKLHDIT